MIDFICRTWKKYREILLYLIFGVLTTAVNYASYFALTRWAGVNLVASNLIAWALSVLFAYGTNRRWVFESKASGGAVLRELGMFVGARVLSGLMDTALMVVLVEWLGINDMIAKLLTGVLVVIVNYVLSKLVIFRKRKD